MNRPQIIRSNIMEFIFQVDDVKVLETIYQQMRETVKKEPYPNLENDDDILAIAKEPIPEYISPEQIAAEQGISSSEGFWEVMDNWDYELFEDESLEDMLNTLTK